MKTMMVAATLLVALIIPPLASGQYGAGSTNSSSVGFQQGYQPQATGSGQQGGYYYKAVPYTTPGYWHCGRWYGGRTYYRYEQVWVPTGNQTIVQDNAPETAIGSVNTDNSQTYIYNIQSTQLPGGQGTTVWGAQGSYPATGSVIGQGDIYPNVDLGALADQQFRLASNIGVLHDKMTSGHKAFSQQLAAQQHDLQAQRDDAMLMATMLDGMARMLAARRGGGTGVSTIDASAYFDNRTEVIRGDGRTTIEPDPAMDPTVMAPSSDWLAKAQGTVDRNCVICHGGERGTKGGLDLRDVSKLSDSQWDGIKRRILAVDDAGSLMPQPLTEGQPAKMLGASDLSNLLCVPKGNQ